MARLLLCSGFGADRRGPGGGHVSLSPSVLCLGGPWPRVHLQGTLSLIPQREAFGGGLTCGFVLNPRCVLFSSQYACGIEAEVVGKPSPEYFQSALKEMGVEAHEVGRSPEGARVWKPLGRGRPGARAGGLRHLWRPAGQPGVDPALHESWFYWEGGESPKRRPAECFQAAKFVSALSQKQRPVAVSK